MKNRFSSNLTLLKPAIRCSNDPCRAVYRVPFCLLPFSLASFSPQPSIYCQVPPHSRTLGFRVVRESLEAWTGVSFRMQWSWGRTGTSGQAGSGLGRDSQGSSGESEVSAERRAELTAAPNAGGGEAAAVRAGQELRAVNQVAPKRRARGTARQGSHEGKRTKQPKLCGTWACPRLQHTCAGKGAHPGTCPLGRGFGPFGSRGHAHLETQWHRVAFLFHELRIMMNQ